MTDVRTMEWSRLLSGCRYGRPGASRDVRSEFQRDIDRILFSDPFRRLARKTQVHPLNENDHIHTRLTHSLETSSVGRSLGEMAGRFLREETGELPGELDPHHVGQVVQAACLAHDIGNPPFGHSGEAAIKNWFVTHQEMIEALPGDCRTDFTRFDGNAMAVRVLVSTGFAGQGMSPTFAVLGALLKYPWPSSFDAGKDKFSCFRAEVPALIRAAGELGLPDLGGRFARHPLAYLTEAADDICYRIIDMEDASELGILDEDFMLRAFGSVLGIPERGERAERYAHMPFRQRNSLLRARLIGASTAEAFALFQARYEAVMTGTLDHRASLMDMAAGEGVLGVIRDVYAGLRERLFMSRRKAVLELGAQNVLGGLLDMTMAEAGRFCSGESSFGRERVRVLLGADAVDRTVADSDTCLYGMILLILDYISGMSDHYATSLGRRLRGFGE